MPRRVTNVTIIDNGDGTCAVQVGPNGYGGMNTQSTFFDRNTFNPDQLAGNIRLARLVGNYVGTGVSAEFLARLKAAGVKLSDADYPVDNLAYNADGTVTVTYGPSTLTVPAAQVEGDTGDQSILLPNVAAFLRKAGYTSLTPQAIAAVAAASFWY